MEGAYNTFELEHFCHFTCEIDRCAVNLLNNLMFCDKSIELLI